jgi:hypothetical protein
LVVGSSLVVDLSLDLLDAVSEVLLSVVLANDGFTKALDEKNIAARAITIVIDAIFLVIINYTKIIILLCNLILWLHEF